MKNLLRVLVMLFLVGSFTSEVKGSHLAAADIYYEYLSPLNYRVHFILYRDCNGVNAPTTFNMSAKDSSCGQTVINFTVDTVGVNDSLNGTVRHQACPNFNPCPQPSPPLPFTGYTYMHYAADITLPYACSDWYFRWQSGARNPNSTVQAANMCIYAKLNNSVRPNNSTILTAEPIPYICVNQPFTYINGPDDPDLDSVVFEATPAGNTIGAFRCTYCTYLPVGPTPNYSPTSPVATNMPVSINPSGYSVDPTTGTVNFTPTQIGAYVLAFTATEYDRITQQVVGVIQRDVQVNVVPCNTVPPRPPSTLPTGIQNLQGATQIATTPVLTLGICPGETMSFEAVGQADSPNNVVHTLANNITSCPGSSYTSNPLGGGNPVTGTFSWTPSAAEVGDHTLVITFVDSTCTNSQTIILKSSVVVLIKVLRGVDIGPDLPICYLGDSIILPALGPEDITQWTWTELDKSGPPHGMGNSHVQNPFVRPTKTTTYIVNTNGQTACKNNDTITVYIDSSVTVEGAASPAVLCEPGLTNLSATGFGPPPSYECGQENVACAGVSAAYLFGSSATYNFGITPFYGSRSGARSQVIYTAAELAAAGWTGPRRIDSLTYDIISKNSTGTYNMQINMGCTYLNDIQQFIPSSLMKNVYQDEAYLTKAGRNTFDLQTPFIWDGVRNLVIDVCFYNLNAVGVDEIASSSTAPNNQFIGSTSSFAGCQIPDVQSTLPTISTNRPNIEIHACDVPATPWQYRWSGPYLFDSTSQNVRAFVNDNPATYRVYTTGGNGCLVWDDVDVVLSTHDVVVEPTQTSICLNDRARIKAIGKGDAPSESFQWFVDANSDSSDLSCTNCAIPEITPKTTGIHRYTVVRTDFYGCTDTAVTIINVLSLPNVSITNGDSAVVHFGDELHLIAEGGVKYSWSPSWGMSNPNISSPVINPSESRTYTVIAIDDNGCGNQDEIWIKVDFAHNLFIPTAFSPNEDGKNDIFRIANFGDQRVSEFRVYNRWGQQVFFANNNRGWDGTFRGVKQDAGAYHYLIKAAFADGHEETFKGDVTLVR